MVVIRLRLFMKARIKGNVILLVVNLGTLAFIEYSSMMFIPAKKRIIERKQPDSSRQQPAKFPIDVYAALNADSENNLLKIPL